MFIEEVTHPTYTYWSHEPEMYDLWCVVVPAYHTHDTYYSL